jgi:3D (Asp-Asp-Asp) domain-containing protein
MYKILLAIPLALVPLIPGPAVHYQAELKPEPEPPPSYEVVLAEVSAYTSSPDETWGDPFETASGERVRDGVIACPERYEFGTVVEIEGKEFECLDRMNKRYRDGNYFDIWMTEKELAYEWGRKKVEVKIR